MVNSAQPLLPPRLTLVTAPASRLRSIHSWTLPGSARAAETIAREWDRDGHRRRLPLVWASGSDLPTPAKAPARDARDGGDGAVMPVIIGSSDRGARGFRESSSGPSTMDRE